MIVQLCTVSRLASRWFLNDESLKKIGSVSPNVRELNLGNCKKILGEGVGEVMKICYELWYKGPQS